MSTRSTTHFTYDGKQAEAIVYRHSDGCPKGAGVDIYKFLARVKAEVKDTRFNDASYLAAKYVVFLAGEFTTEWKWDSTTEGHYEPAASKFDFLSVGVVREDPDDIEYRYVVNCGKFDKDGFLEVVCYELHGRTKRVPIPRAEVAEVVAAK